MFYWEHARVWCCLAWMLSYYAYFFINRMFVIYEKLLYICMLWWCFKNLHEHFLKMGKHLMMCVVDESAGYIRRDGFDSKIDFGPMFVRWTSVPWFWTSVPCLWLHMSMDACFIILSCESTLNGIHDSFISRYPLLLFLLSSSYTCWALWLMFVCIIPGEGKAREEDKPSEFGALE